MKDRATGWLDPAFHAAFREAILHAAVRERLFCPVYTLMPDHIHLIWMGLGPESDQRLGAGFLRRTLTPALKPCFWQHQAFDRVLRADERKQRVFATMANYVAENPVRAGLAGQAQDWLYTGCVVPGYPDLHPLAVGFWDRFWRLYQSALGLGALGKVRDRRPDEPYEV